MHLFRYIYPTAVLVFCNFRIWQSAMRPSRFLRLMMHWLCFQAIWALVLIVPTVALANENGAGNPIRLQLKWLHQFQFAGIYAALENGYFADEGLNVSIIERDPRIDTVESVLEGHAEYGIADSILFVHHAQGKPVALVAAIMQHSAGAVMTLASSGLKSPGHLAGRRISFYPNDADGIDVLAMLADHDIPKSQLQRIRASERIKQLISGEVDAVTVYLTNEPFLIRDMGYDINIIHPRHYGFDLYGDMLFTTRTEARDHPERVAAMRRAVLRGWNYALDNKEELVDLILERYNTQGKTRQMLLNEANAIDALVARSVTPLGQLEPGRIDYITRKLDELNLLNPVGTTTASLIIDHNDILKLQLTQEEREFLRSLDPIRFGVEIAGWPPFEYFDAQGEFKGIASDYLNAISNMLGITFLPEQALSWDQVLEAARNKTIDLLPAAASTPARREYMLFSSPYVRSPMVIVTRSDVDFIANPSDLQGHTVGTVSGYASEEILRRHYPELTLGYYKTTHEGLRALATGEIYAFVENLAVATSIIKSEGLANLKISGQTPYSFDLSFAVRNDWPLLQSAIDKALVSMTPQQHAAIQDRWVQVTLTSSVPWTKLATFAVPLLLVLAAMAGYLVHLRILNRRIAQTNSRLELAERELRDKNRMLQELSITDKLTRVFNRHHLDAELNQHFLTAQRYGRPLSLVLLDLDHFKRINDTYGHHTGDEVLVRFAEVVSKRQRKTDIFGRWGGEEFLLICPETPLEGAVKVADAIRQTLSEQTFDQGFTQTVSAGVIEVAGYSSVEQAIIAVDQQLYTAKQTGRNRVAFTQ